MEPKLINFFKYLEDKEGKKTPLKVKLLNPKQFEITPEELIVKGSLGLHNAPITSLPNGLEVEGDLSLSYSEITSLPNGLKVGGHLSLFKASITSLPDGLKVGDYLNLYNTPITFLPNDLEVGGDLYLNDTPLSSKTEAEIRQMAPNVKGKIIGLKKSL